MICELMGCKSSKDLANVFLIVLFIVKTEDYSYTELCFFESDVDN